MDNQVLDKRIYKFLKNEIIRDFDSLFYYRYYKIMEKEFDARVYAKMMTNKFLLSLGIDAATIAELEDATLEKEILEEMKYNREKITDISGETRSINEILLEHLNRRPKEIQSVLDENPLLNLEFEIDNSGILKKKSREEIEKEMNEKLSVAKSENEKRRITELFDYILNGEPEVDFDSMDYITYLNQNGYWDIDFEGEVLADSDSSTYGSGVIPFAKKCYSKTSREDRMNFYQNMKGQRLIKKVGNQRFGEKDGK